MGKYDVWLPRDGMVQQQGEVQRKHIILHFVLLQFNELGFCFERFGVKTGEAWEMKFIHLNQNHASTRIDGCLRVCVCVVWCNCTS